MMTVISQKGQVVIPASLREEMDLRPGDDLEVVRLDDRTLRLERVNRRVNEGLAEALLSGAGLGLEMPERSKDMGRPVIFE